MRCGVVHDANDDAACPWGDFLKRRSFQITAFGFSFEIIHFARVSRVNPFGECCVLWEIADGCDACVIEACGACGFFDDFVEWRHWSSLLSSPARRWAIGRVSLQQPVGAYARDLPRADRNASVRKDARDVGLETSHRTPTETGAIRQVSPRLPQSRASWNVCVERIPEWVRLPQESRK